MIIHFYKYPMNVNEFIKVTKLSDGLVSVVPAKNRSQYEQANDIEKKAKKNELYTIEEPTEDEVYDYYPELAKQGKQGKPSKGKTYSEEDLNKKVEETKATSSKIIEDKDKEIAALKEQLTQKQEGNS